MREIDKKPQKFKGVLVKRKKYFIFRKYWAIVNKGYLIFYRSEEDADKDQNRLGTFGLRNAALDYNDWSKLYGFKIKYGCGKKQKFSTLKSLANKNGLTNSWNSLTRIEYEDKDGEKSYSAILRKKWIEAIKDNIEYWNLRSNFEIQYLERIDSEKSLLSYYTQMRQKSVVSDKQSLVGRALGLQNMPLKISSSSNDESLTNDRIENELHSLRIKESESDTTSDEDDDSRLDMFSCRSRLSSRNTSKNVVVTKIEFSTLIDQDLDYDKNGWRLKLPAKQFDRSKISLWSIAKNFIGKELTRMTMPIILCEPLSFLQRFKESAQYCVLLNKASKTLDPCKRLELIAAFSIAPFSNIMRLTKPFNPILGETFEVIREDLGFKSVSEQVSHHPPISAFQTDSLDQAWTSYGHVQSNVKFYGRSLGLETKGLITLEFRKFNETYTWQPANCTVYNVIFGTPWFQYHGSQEIVCHQTGYKAVLNFRTYSRTTKELNKLDGFIYDNKMNKVRALFGDWSDSFYSCDVSSLEKYLATFKKVPTQNELVYMKDCDELLKVIPSPEHANQYYKFSYFGMTLNQLRPEFEKLLPPTDSRFRPDVRQLELGNLDFASDEKSRLEEKQREAARNRKKSYQCKWFNLKKHPILGMDAWTFNNKYWLRNYKDCPDLF